MKWIVEGSGVVGESVTWQTSHPRLGRCYLDGRQSPAGRPFLGNHQNHRRKTDPDPAQTSSVEYQEGLKRFDQQARHWKRRVEEKRGMEWAGRLPCSGQRNADVERWEGGNVTALSVKMQKRTTRWDESAGVLRRKRRMTKRRVAWSSFVEVLVAAMTI